jgi:UDP-3-O-[3-hydroxymyristoyl] glucosamine N-acyltransferase
VLGADVRIGADCFLYPRVTLAAGSELGERTRVHSGVVVGSDGFGFARDADGWIKVPQLGRVRIGADVEIGANTTIDRGAIEDTVIEDGVKLDNLIQIGHNVQIGAHTVIAACTGISGSTRIGARCVIAGAVGVAGHLNICDDVVVTGKSSVTHSLTAPGVYSGCIPVTSAPVWRRLVGRFKRLDTLNDRVRRLERADNGLQQQDQD